MSPFGKFCLAIVGLRFFGAEGFFVGLILGHLLVDRTVLIKKLKSALSTLDDNVRIMLPFKYYRLYNRLDGCFWGKLLGGLIGAVLYGLDGFIVLFILGHYLFDTPRSHHAGEFRRQLDFFIDKNLAKIIGAVGGFVCQSHILMFVGIVLGFFVDSYRIEQASMFPFAVLKGFWLRCNPLKWWVNSKEARHVAYVQAVSGLAVIVAKTDGAVSENEIKVFKKLFIVTEKENTRAAKIFKNAKTSDKDLKTYAKQLKLLTENNLSLKESVIDNLFKIAAADSQVSEKEFILLKKIADMIELPEGNFEVIQGIYRPRGKNATTSCFYEVLGVAANAGDDEVKRRWKELIIKYHPDRLQSRGASEKEIQLSTQRMAEINNAYQVIMKSRRAA